MNTLSRKKRGRATGGTSLICRGKRQSEGITEELRCKKMHLISEHYVKYLKINVTTKESPPSPLSPHAKYLPNLDPSSLGIDRTTTGRHVSMLAYHLPLRRRPSHHPRLPSVRAERGASTNQCYPSFMPRSGFLNGLRSTTPRKTCDRFLPAEICAWTRSFPGWWEARRVEGGPLRQLPPHGWDFSRIPRAINYNTAAHAAHVSFHKHNFNFRIWAPQLKREGIKSTAKQWNSAMLSRNRKVKITSIIQREGGIPIV